MLMLFPFIWNNIIRKKEKRDNKTAKNEIVVPASS
jgi:hypothetical protein